MAVIVFDKKAQRLVANAGGTYVIEESSMSLRVRRLFYVGKFAAVGVLGQMPNPVHMKDILRGLVLATAKYETTRVFEIPVTSFSRKAAFDNDVEYVVMTKKGLYRISDEKFLDLDDSETTSFGIFASVFNVVFTKLKEVEKSIKYIGETSSFISADNIVVKRADLGETFDLDSKDVFATSYRVDSR